MTRRPLIVLACLLVATAADASHLLFDGAVLNGSGGVTGMGRPEDVAISPDGRFLYATGTTDDSVLRFARDPATGALTFLDRVIGDTATPPGPIPHLALPKALSLSPDGAQLYVAGGTHGAGTSAVTWFERDATTGALSYRGSILDDSGPGLFYLDTPLDVLVSRDGASVYVTAFEARAVTVFARAPGTGDLSFLQDVVDDVGGVDGLEGIQRVAESPDGSTLYVASASRPATVPGPGGIAVFARAADGTLTFLEVKQQGVGGIDGLGAPRDVAVSPDGKSVYVAAGGKLGNSPPVAAGVARFDRAPDGRLTFAGSIPESAFGYGEPRGIAVAADGTNVYAVLYGVNSGVTGTTPGKLVVFDRDPQTGAIAVADRMDDGKDGVLSPEACAHGSRPTASTCTSPPSSIRRRRRPAPRRAPSRSSRRRRPAPRAATASTTTATGASTSRTIPSAAAPPIRRSGPIAATASTTTATASSTSPRIRSARARRIRPSSSTARTASTTTATDWSMPTIRAARTRSRRIARTRSARTASTTTATARSTGTADRTTARRIRSAPHPRGTARRAAGSAPSSRSCSRSSRGDAGDGRNTVRRRVAPG